MARQAEAFFKESRLDFAQVDVDGTPRRLVLRVSKLADRQPDRSEEVQGPSAKVAFGPDGQPTKVAEGFARTRGVAVTALTTRATPKGDYVFARVDQPGQWTADLLAQWLPVLTKGLNFPKSMRWGQGGPLRFARPIQWLCAVLGEDLVEFKIDQLPSSVRTLGHRFLAPEAVPVRHAEGFGELLAKSFVMLSQAEREKNILTALHQQCRKAGLSLIEDQELVEICANLVEWPSALLGSFDPGYLQIPEEMIICALREHQRYFAARDAEGKLAPNFLVVTNGTRENLAGVREGNESVLKARLEDARFFFREDTKAPLADKLAGLKKVVWLEGYGSLEQKSQRLQKLAEWLGDRVAPADKAHASRAALLCKCDLISEVVGEKEFTSLQGTMGGIYAKLSGEDPAVCRGISEHYRPRHAGDAIPESRSGQLVALADKLDDLTGCFAAGLVPTGSQDPYALRRKAAGVMAILLAQDLDLSLVEAVHYSISLTRASGGEVKDPAALATQLLEFLRQRLEVALVERGHAPDVIAAVLSKRFELPREAVQRAAAIRELRKREDFESTAKAFSRVNNILGSFSKPSAIDLRLLSGGAEKSLHERFLGARPAVERACQAGLFIQAYEEMARLRTAIDAYFDSVMVMDENEALRHNRLSFLHQIGTTLNLIADFTKLDKK
jgi:glycyl-tRNA synthetase beta chain